MSKRKNPEATPAAAAPEPVKPGQIARGQLEAIYNVLGTAKGIYKTTLARVTALSIRKRLEATCMPIAEARRDALTMPAAFTEARIAACRELADKNTAGDPVTKDGVFVFSAENQAKVEKRVAELRAEHKEALDAYEAGIADFNAFIVEKVDFPADLGSLRIKLSTINDSATMEELEALWPVIENDVPAA